MNTYYYQILNGLLAAGYDPDIAIEEAKRIQDKVNGGTTLPDRPQPPVIEPEPPIVKPDQGYQAIYACMGPQFKVADFYTSVGIEKSVSSEGYRIQAVGEPKQYCIINAYGENCWGRFSDNFTFRFKEFNGFSVQYGNSFKTRVTLTPDMVYITLSNGFVVSKSLPDTLEQNTEYTLGIYVHNEVWDIGVSMPYDNASLSYRFDLTNTNGPILPDTAFRELQFIGVTDMTFTEIEMCINDTSWGVMFIGDSITCGYNGGTSPFRVLVDRHAPYMAGPGDGTQRILDSFMSIAPYIKPKVVMVGIGVNDREIPRPAYTRLVEQIVAMGARPQLFLMANDIRNQVADWDWIRTTWPEHAIGFVWNDTLKPGSTTGQVRPEYKSDQNHFNAMGHKAIADAILKYQQ